MASYPVQASCYDFEANHLLVLMPYEMYAHKSHLCESEHVLLLDRCGVQEARRRAPPQDCFAALYRHTSTRVASQVGVS